MFPNDSLKYWFKGKGHWSNVSDKDWLDWRWQMKNRIKTADGFSSFLNLSKDEKEDEDLKRLLAEGYLKRLHIIKKQGLRFAILGVLGKGAADFATGKHPVKFSDPIKTLKKVVAKVHRKKMADVIILLSHCGLKNIAPFEGEEIEIARNVSGIDIIVGGHSHTALKNPITVNKTIIINKKNWGAC